MMMDAVEFLKEKERMCSKCGMCAVCPADRQNNGFDMDCCDLEVKKPEELVAIVERWSAERPKKTRQSELLKMFPGTRINLDGVIDIDPCFFDKKIEHHCEKYDSCDDCYKEYWLSEID